MLTKEIKELSKSEKIVLINDLWEDIAEIFRWFPSGSFTL